MNKSNKVFIATSLDGYIADKDGGLDWLTSVPFPKNSDMGYSEFASKIDALVMGRTTFETVCGFDVDWPYKQPVYVLSNTLNEIPEDFKDKAQLIKGTLPEVIAEIHQNGHYHLYIDGGKTIQSFLNEDLIDTIVISVIPKLLGDGIPLFSKLPNNLEFECLDSKVYSNKVVQNTFSRKRT